MPEFVLTTTAKKSLRKTGKYTKENWGVDKQKSYIDSFYKAFDKLVQSPFIGKEQHKSHKGLRSYNCQKHVIFYRIDNDDIVIVNILHEKMDADKWLSKKLDDLY